MSSNGGGCETHVDVTVVEPAPCRAHGNAADQCAQCVARGMWLDSGGDPAPVPVPAAPDPSEFATLLAGLDADQLSQLNDQLLAAIRDAADGDRCEADPGGFTRLRPPGNWGRWAWTTEQIVPAKNQEAAMRGDAEAEDEDMAAVEEKPGHWITEEVERARKRMATVPPHARPMWTPGSFGDPARRRPSATAAAPEPFDRCAVCGAPLHAACAPLPDGGNACSVRCVDLARFAAAVGVRVDPDDPDPVGTVEKTVRALRADVEGCCDGCGLCSAYGHLRCWVHDQDGGDKELRALLCGEPEVVSGAEVVKLPDDSIYVACHEDGRPMRGHSVVTTGWEPPWPFELSPLTDYRVLYRAPEPPAAPLAVGDEVASAEDLIIRAPVGTIVDDGARVARRKITCWTVTGVEGATTALDLAYPVTVVRVGGGPDA